MANLQDLLKSLQPLEQEKEAPVPNQVPYASFTDAAQTENEVPAPEIAQVIQQATRTPAAKPVAAPVSTKSAGGTFDIPADGSTEVEMQKPLGVAERLEKLLAERKNAYADAEKRQGNADLIASLAGDVGNFVGGSVAMNSKAAIKSPKTGFTATNTLKNVDGKYKPELDQLMAQYKSLQGANKPMTEYQKMMLAHMGKQLDQSSLNSDRAMDRFNRGEDRRWDNQTFTQEEKQEITPGQAKEFAAVDKTLDSLEKIDGMNDFSTGPISGRVQKAMRFAGQGSPERVALQAQLNMVTSQYANAISGTAVGEGEFKRIQEQLPNENDAPEAFAAKLANFKETMENSRLRLLDTYQKAGKNLDALKNRTSIEDLRKNAGKDTAPSYPKQVRNGKGEVATVSSAEEEKEAKAEGFN